MPARSRAARCLVVVALLVVSGLAPATAVATPDETPDAHPTVDGTVTASAADPGGNTTITVDIQSDGDAEWNITLTQTVSNESDAADLDAIAREYEAGDTPYLSMAPFRTAAESVSDAVGREMEITDVDRTGSAENETLRLSVSFTWTNFAERTDRQITVRDVFNGTTGRWFGAGTDDGPGLTSDQRLVIIPPDEYDISSVSRDASVQQRTIRWEGPIRFDSESPYAVFVRDTPDTPTTTPTTVSTLTSTITTTTVPGQSGTDDGMGALLVPLFIFLGVLAAAVYVVTRADVTVVPPSDDSETEESGTDDPTASTEATTAADSGESTPSESTTAAAAGSESTAEDDIDETLLSDEERVERLLERNGGRMKQANIVTETGWSNAKVSQLLSSMADEGRIEKLRIGRENLISFPDEDLTDDSE